MLRGRRNTLKVAMSGLRRRDTVSKVVAGTVFCELLEMPDCRDSFVL